MSSPEGEECVSVPKEGKASGSCDVSARRRSAIFVNLITTCVALAMMSTAMNTTLAPLVGDLGVSVALGQWVTSGYALALAVVMPLTAYLVTRFSSRSLYLFAVGSYALASLCCAAAPSFALLMAGRVAQACMNGAIANLTQVSILSLFGPGSRGKAMGWFGLSQGAAVVAGPVLGGFLADAFGWRAVFFGVALICAASFSAAQLTLVNLLPVRNRPFDVVGFILSVLAFGGLSLGLGSVVSAGLSPLVLGALLVGAGGAGLFAARQLASAEPFLDVRLLGMPVFSLATGCSAALYACSMASSAVLPLQVQMGLGQSAAWAGLVVLPGAVVLALVNPLSGSAFDRFGIRPLCLGGGLCVLTANLATCIPGVQGSLMLLTAVNMVRCLGFGLLQMPLVTWANSCLGQAELPHASALLTALRNVAGAVGVAVGASLFQLAGGSAAFAVMAGLSLLLFLPVAVRLAKAG